MTNELVNEYGEMCKITINRTIYRKNELLKYVLRITMQMWNVETIKSL
jgi:hypothetical protein